MFSTFLVRYLGNTRGKARIEAAVCVALRSDVARLRSLNDILANALGNCQHMDCD